MSLECRFLSKTLFSLFLNYQMFQAGENLRFLFRTINLIIAGSLISWLRQRHQNK